MTVQAVTELDNKA
ncbi:hypothetical protein EC900039_2106A, partial [Escherichia coli 90.0039]